MSALGGWQNFYVIVGSAAGALIGLQFVVLTLVAGLPGVRRSGGEVFSTPTIIHFGTALLMSAVMNVPWHVFTPVAVAWGIIGAFGIFYSIATAVRLYRLTIYIPEFEDWLFHAILPTIAYAAVLAAACIALSFEDRALLAIGAAVLLLLFVGIHNAWDTVTYHVFTKPEQKQ